jgi:hypothetical protein
MKFHCVTSSELEITSPVSIVISSTNIRVFIVSLFISGESYITGFSQVNSRMILKYSGRYFILCQMPI